MNESSLGIPATSQCGHFVQIRKWHLFLKMDYHHLLQFVKITITDGELDGEGPLDFTSLRGSPVYIYIEFGKNTLRSG